MNDSFKSHSRGFVFNDVDPGLFEEDRDLGFGWILRRIRPAELNNHHLRSGLRSYALLRGYEHGVPVVLQDVQRKSDTWVVNDHRLSEAQMHKICRVSVLESDGNPRITPWHLRYALGLADAELKVGCFLGPANSGASFWWEYSGFRINNFRWDDELHQKRASVSDLSDLRETVQYMASKDVPDEIHGAIRLFLSLDALPDDANMKRLGYFAVIEALLSHPSNDPVDSIRKQLSRNLILVDHRLKEVGRSLGFENFGDMSPDKLIGRLYSYRSNIAHGGNGVAALIKLNDAVENFDPWPKTQTSKSNPDTAWIGNWLRRLVRRVLFSAIREPQLITDLK